MKKIILITVVLNYLLVPTILGQDLSVPTNKSKTFFNQANISLSIWQNNLTDQWINGENPLFFTNSSFQINHPITPAPLPKYARENPAGHSYLCRLEVKIEKKLPIGIWMKVGDSAGIANSTGNNAHFRLRLKSF